MALEREDMQLYLLAGIIAVFAFLSYLLIAPFLYYIIGAVVLVYISYPAYNWIEARVGSASVASALAIILLLVVAVVPTLFMTERVISQGQQALVAVGSSTTEFIDTDSLEQTILELTGEEVDVEQAIRNAFVEAGRLISGEVPGLISTLFDALVGIFVMGVTMYYLFKEGGSILDASLEVLPMDREREEKLLKEVDRMAEAVLVGHVLTALLQGVVAGIGLWAVGIPNAVFWTFVMVLLGIIPLLGNFLVWGPAGLYLIFMQDQMMAGVALLVYSTVVVGITDNFVRARVVGKRGRIHPLLVMVGVIGGLPVFGILGVVLGPLVLGFLISLTNVYKEDFLKK